jgi:hypothetical protein
MLLFQGIARQHTHQHANVGLRGAADHVGHEALVSRGVNDRKVLLLRGEVCLAVLHSLALGALLVVGVHGPREVPALSVLLLGLALVLFKRAFVDAARKVPEKLKD